MVLFLVLVFLSVTLSILYFISCQKSTQRKWKNLNFVPSQPVLFFGQHEFKSVLEKSYIECIDSLYQKAKGHTHCCIFQFSTPTIMVLEPRLIGDILAKNSSFFQDRTKAVKSGADIDSQNLYNLNGEVWKKTSKLISPIVSPERMKHLIGVMDRCERKYDLNCYINESKIDIEAFVYSLNREMVYPAAVGVDAWYSSATAPSVAEIIQQIYRPNFKMFFFHYLSLIFPSLRFNPVPTTAKNSLINFTRGIFEDETTNSKSDLAKNSKNILRFLTKATLKKFGTAQKTPSSKESENDSFPEKDNVDEINTDIQTIEEPEIRDISGYLFWFLAKTHGTNSAALEFTLHILSQHPDCQRKIKEELDEALNTRDERCITYEVIKDLKYTHKVIKESLRLYPPIPIIKRVCTQDYLIPNTSQIISKGTEILIPIFSIHRDPQYFPQPEDFIPERFDDGCSKKILPFTFMPFGEGPRFCIGFRLAMAHLKYIIARLVSKFEVLPPIDSKKKLKLHYLSPLLLKSKDKLFMKLKKRF